MITVTPSQSSLQLFAHALSMITNGKSVYRETIRKLTKIYSDFGYTPEYVPTLSCLRTPLAPSGDAPANCNKTYEKTQG